MKIGEKGDCLGVCCLAQIQFWLIYYLYHRMLGGTGVDNVV